MAKPFVLITHEANREALRNSGVLPESFFHEFDVNSNGLRKDGEDDGALLYFWPYDLNYRPEAFPSEDHLYKPDVPGFFGLAKPANDAEKRHNERLITGLLSSVMIHVVFLDSRRGEHGYAAFKSFEEIVKWGQNLRRALNVRFQNEAILQSMESVLVIVARGEQVSLRASDVEQFNGCVQQSRSDVYVQEHVGSNVPRQRKIFRSCYFLDYNLCVRDSRELYHSAEIWDVMVGRLILSFLLSRNDQVRWWQVPGVKLWRTFDCVSEIDAKSDRNLVNETLAQANRAMQDLVADAKSLESLRLLKAINPPSPPTNLFEPDDSANPNWRKAPSGGWSAYDTEACARNTCDISRWAGTVEKVRRELPGWKITSAQQADTQDSKAVFKFAHMAPGNLLRVVREVHAKLHSVRYNIEPRKDWMSLVKTEHERVAASRKVKSDAPALESAQKHYVGFGLSMIIVAAVCAALGTSVYYLVHTMSSLFAIKTPDVLVSLFFFVFIAFGSVSAALLIYICHARAGRRAFSVLAEESEHVDTMMKKRDGMARSLLVKGTYMRDLLIMRAHRFRTWALLDRAKSILLTELQPSVAERGDEADDAEAVSGQTERRSVRETFLKRTRRAFGPYRIMPKEDIRLRIERLVAQWWSENDKGRIASPFLARSFQELWRSLCVEDQELAGHFPARLFANEIRAFVARFTNAVRITARGLLMTEHVQELRQGLLAWYEKLQNGDYYLYASGAVTGEHVNEDGLENARVYFADSSIVDMDRIADLRVGSQADRSRFLPEFRTELNQTDLLALMFQEIRVRFCTDANGNDLGRLQFEAVSDIAGDQNG